MNDRVGILPLAIAVAVVAGAAGMTPATMPPDARSAVAVFPAGDEVVLELAADPVTRARGYMFREDIGPNEGMLFVFDEPDRHSFWMRNCRVALDIIWLDDSFRVVHQERGMAPCEPDGRCPSIVPFRPARYVIEVAAGGAERLGIRDGDRVVVLWH